MVDSYCTHHSQWSFAEKILDCLELNVVNTHLPVAD